MPDGYTGAEAAVSVAEDGINIDLSECDVFTVDKVNFFVDGGSISGESAVVENGLLKLSGTVSIT